MSTKCQACANKLNIMLQVLISGLYPGGPYARKLMCVELLNVVLDCWIQPSESSGPSKPGRVGGPIPRLGDSHECDLESLVILSRQAPQGKSARAQRQASPAAAAVVLESADSGARQRLGDTGAPYSTNMFQPFFSGFLGPHTVTMLLNGVIDSWDR
jgi:hypothetical protein